MLRVPGIPERLAGRRPRSFADSARSISRSRPASPRRSTGRRRSPRSAAQELDAEVVEQTLGSVLKYREDFETVRDETLVGLVEEARSVAQRWRRMRARSSATSSRSGACCARPGSRSVRGASRMRSPGSTRRPRHRRTTSTGRCGRRSCREPRSSSSSTARSRAWFLRAPSRRSCRGTKPASRSASPRGRTRTIARRRRRARRGDEATEIGWSSHEILRGRTLPAMTPEEFERVLEADSAIAASRPAATVATPAATSARPSSSTCAGSSLVARARR